MSDEDRQRTAALLGDAAGAGLLTLDELDQRLGDAWSAKVGKDLAALEADLPPEVRRARDRRDATVRARDAARDALPAHVLSYAAVMALLLTIWLLVGITGGSWYPWPIWPALGWGIGVVGHLRAARTPVH